MTNLPNSLNNQSTLNYCINKAIPDGSNLYYATLFDKKNKNRIITLHALLNELSDIIYECSDPGVARIKFKWWQEEILRLKEQQPRHPVTKQLNENHEWKEESLEILLRAIASFEQFIFLEQPDTLTTILPIFKTSYGSIWRLYAIQSGINNIELLNAVEEMGALNHFLNCLQQPYTYITESRCIIPVSYIKHSTLLDLRFNKTNPTLEQHNVIKQLLHDLTTQLQETYQTLSNNNQACFRYALISNKLATKTAHEMIQEGLNLLNNSIGLTPIHKLWIAWRTDLSLR